MPRIPKKATTAKSGIRKPGDRATNARKRYYRAAERNLEKAKESTGATASRYRELARQNFEDALSTYDPTNTQRISKPMQRLADEFNVDIEQRRETQLKAIESDSRRYEAIENKQRLSIFRSQNVLETNLQDEEFRSEVEARIIMSSPIGSRIIGGLVDVWRDKATVNGKIDKDKIIESIMKYFKVETLSELLKKIESKIGNKLYQDPENESIYDNIKLILQTKLVDNTLVD